MSAPNANPHVLERWINYFHTDVFSVSILHGFLLEKPKDFHDLTPRELLKDIELVVFHVIGDQISAAQLLDEQARFQAAFPYLKFEVRNINRPTHLNPRNIHPHVHENVVGDTQY